GQKKIKTPNIDRLAEEGIRFTNAYAGNSVCAPSRSSLMEGKHPGHARVRGNAYASFRESLRPGDYTVAMLLQENGYKTGLFGKWGLALHDQPGLPNDMGFDEFYGYLNQQQAHTYYPEFLYHNRERVYYPENKYHYLKENYSRASSYDEEGKVIPNGLEGNVTSAKNSFDEYCKRSLDFVRENKDNPFFLYLAYTMPHGPLIVPELGEYKDKDWDIQFKEWAAMITRMDIEVGKLLALLEELKLDDNTVIFFASDNGLSSQGYEARYLNEKPGPTLSEFFDHAPPVKGLKGGSDDGSFRVPAMVRWPGKVKPGQVNGHIWAFWDFMPTVADIIGIETGAATDGLSILPVLTGEGRMKEHEYLYWEHAQNQAVRMGKWFGRRVSGKEVELYDLEVDPQQSNDLSASNKPMAERIAKIMDDSHTPSDVWPSPGETREEFKKRLKEANVPERPDNMSLY
ncbi:MAG: arylsulfatase, partial [Bacteroidales bacterium]|nr:arylsulfatase [Bacteroidales bacterium]